MSRSLPAGLPGLGLGGSDEFLAKARAIATGEIKAVTPRHAATVILLRDRPEGIQCYLLRRVRTMAFAAGVYVFPGGAVDERDVDLSDSFWSGPPPGEWGAALTADDGLARALVCAAVRETFEESGVLLAGERAGDVVAETTGDEWEADRAALVDRSLSMSALLERRDLVLRSDLLRPWAHWITPEVETKRYDTRFFVAALPTGQRTRDVGGEADLVEWARPADALARAQSGDIGMLPPTAVNLEELAGYATVADALAAGTGREITTVAPRLVVDEEDRLHFLMPGDPGYARE